MKTIASLILFLLLLSSCIKKQLKETTLIINKPIDQQVYHKNDTVYLNGEISYSKGVKKIGFFAAMVNDANDSTFFKRTILPLEDEYSIREYYINEFNDGANVTLSYGKRNVSSNQIYELKTIKLIFLP